MSLNTRTPDSPLQQGEKLLWPSPSSISPINSRVIKTTEESKGIPKIVKIGELLASIEYEDACDNDTETYESPELVDEIDDSLTKDLFKVRKQERRHRMKITHLKQAIQEILHYNQDLVEGMQDLVPENERLRALVLRLELENQRLREQKGVQPSTDEISSLENTIHYLEQHNKELEGKLLYDENEARKMFCNMEKDLVKVREKLSSERSGRLYFKDKCAALENKLESFRFEISQLLQHLKWEKDGNKKLEQHCAELEFQMVRQRELIAANTKNVSNEKWRFFTKKKSSSTATSAVEKSACRLSIINMPQRGTITSTLSRTCHPVSKRDRKNLLRELNITSHGDKRHQLRFKDLALAVADGQDLMCDKSRGGFQQELETNRSNPRKSPLSSKSTLVKDPTQGTALGIDEHF